MHGITAAICIMLSCVGVCYGASIVELAVATPELSTLVTALQAGNLVGALSAASPQYTVFAPTNAAFAALPNGELDSVLDPKNIDHLQFVLKYHVIVGKIPSGDLMDTQDVLTLNGNKVSIVKRDGAVYVNGAKVIRADVDASNGVVHIVDKVVEITKNVVEVVVAEGDLSTLVAAVKAGDLVGALSATGPFTIFAPVNSAFAALPKGTLDSLLDPKNVKNLQNVLTYHVIAGGFAASALADSQVVKTLNGQEVTIVKRGGAVYVNDAKVLDADNIGINGVVHTVDKVLLPPATNAAGAASGQTKTSESSLIRASLLFAMASLLMVTLVYH